MLSPRIVFVTTCKGRIEHVKKTLLQNMTDNIGYANCKFVLMDYNSGDGLQEYIKSVCVLPTENGYLTVYSFPTADRFHASHAKNLAMRCAMLEGADILVTQDADNYTGPGFAQFIADRFLEAGPWAGTPAIWPGMFLCPNFPHIKSLPHGPESGRPDRGYAGRLAIRAKDFIKMGGYDEGFDTWHGEDVDMIARLDRLGYAMRHFENKNLRTIPHGADVRFKEYPHAKQYENDREWKVIADRTTTVVNNGQFGCGTVYKNFDFTNPIMFKPLPTRIFGIGMHKTGTTALHHAFEILGFDSLHWGTGEAPRIWQEMQANGRSNLLEQWYAFSDLPFPLLYEKLDKAYPNSKFILTVRNEEDWIKSVEGLWDAKSNPTRWVWDKYPFTNRIHRELYGQTHFDREVFLERYRRHNAEVVAYFGSRIDDLTIMHDRNTGWHTLCRFLGVPVPDVPYPVSNKTSANREYIELVESGESYCEPESKPDVIFNILANGESILSSPEIKPGFPPKIHEDAEPFVPDPPKPVGAAQSHSFKWPKSTMIDEAKALAAIPAWQDMTMDILLRNYKVVAVVVILAFLLGFLSDEILVHFRKSWHI